MQSLTEAAINIAIGYVIGLAAQVIVFHMYHLPVSWSQNFQMSIIFTVISLVRSYLLRRLFNKLHAPKVQP